ncbi:histidine kinase [Georgenia sp. M64]|uniref:sensor histidine kinase n=1 Tax=Georgenia sp. M64 TaxID=3120520 RepID=UPI0030DF99D9
MTVHPGRAVHGPGAPAGADAPATPDGTGEAWLRPGPVSRLMRAHPWWVDGLLAAAYLALGVGDWLVQAELLDAPRPRGELALTAVFTAFVLLRRHAAVLGVAVVAVAVPLHRYLVAGLERNGLEPGFEDATLRLGLNVTAYDAGTMALLLYAVAVYRTARTAWVTMAGAIVAVTVSVLTFADSWAWVTEIVVSSALLVVATVVGLQVRARRRRMLEMTDRARQLALERDQREQLAVSAERTRIAREMHDVVAHSLTVMVTLAEGAAASLERSPDQARRALAELAETGRTALTDTRRIVGVLRADLPAPSDGITGPAGVGESPLAPQPGQHDVAGLVDRFRSAGLPVRLAEQGPALPDEAGLQLAVYRIVQEALTNVLRYARLSPRIDVSLVRSAGSVVIEVDNDAGGAGTAAAGSGHGLIGIRERAAVYGGTVDAGPTPHGWQVRATLRWDEEDG